MRCSPCSQLFGWRRPERRLLCHRTKPLHIQTMVLRCLWQAGGMPTIAKLLKLPVANFTLLPPIVMMKLAVTTPLAVIVLVAESMPPGPVEVNVTVNMPADV